MYNMKELRLTPEEEAMLAGEQGPGVKRAMEIVVALARIYGYASPEELLAGLGSPKCLLLDFHMPKMNAIELLAQLSRNGVRIPTRSCRAKDEVVKERERRALGSPFSQCPQLTL